ncbi:hypothetical protein ACTJJB_08555 [Chitinophaga sp. 22536]|uniref:hypothetical protein n=1 Tax=unclassified Chitinophaga TaxID=2619133 RepID=UPI003F86A0AB
MITKHQYLDRYPISPESTSLILGTIHPHDVRNFQIPFFYGNRNSIWNLLSDAFPNSLQKPITLGGVISFLNDRKIAVTNTVRQCRRVNPTALDQDLIPEILHHEIRVQIAQSKIDRILCTSSFGKNNAFRLFYSDILGQKITPAVRTNREVLLSPSIFGKPVLLKALYSPSGSSNVSLSRHPLYLNKRNKYVGSARPVYDFKVDYYRQQFSM